jgi:prepilin-type N-terminal cleavage/methylation domain-containing protein
MAGHLHSRNSATRGGFSLTEMLVVMVVIGLLMTMGFRIFGSASRARRSAADAVAGMVDQARNTAIRKRHPVLLVVAGPKDVPDPAVQGNRCRLGLFELTAPPNENGEAEGRLLERWRPLPKGIAALGGEADGLRNVLDDGGLLLRYKAGGEEIETMATGIVFTPRGGLAWPKGSDPVVIRLVEGTYLEGVPTRTRHNGGRDEVIRIGRVVARPWRTGS